MTDIVNLRLARKRKARAAEDRQAAENRVAFGRRKEERALAEASKAQQQGRLEAHRLRDGEDT